jgi:RND superfamily putative drug exporter
VADGLATTARVITAAALIMVFVFGSFLLESDRVVKLFGTGLAAAVLLDATIVRMLLVPATMELLGDRNWWLPRWLGRILPRVDVEGHEQDATIEDAADQRELEPV